MSIYTRLNFQLVMRELHFFLNFKFLLYVSSIPLGHSENNCCDFSKTNKTVFCDFLLWECPNYVRIKVDESL